MRAITSTGPRGAVPTAEPLATTPETIERLNPLVPQGIPFRSAVSGFCRMPAVPKMRWMPLVVAAAAITACSGTADPQLALMAETPAQLPGWFTNPPIEDLAQVGSVDQLNVFAGRDGEDNWCVVLAIEPTTGGPDWMAASSCAPSERFAAEGVSVTISSTRDSSALLLPDDFSGQMEDGWERINDNLAVRR